MDHRVIWDTRAERIVLGAVLGGGAGALLGLVGSPACFLPRAAGGGGRDLDRVPRDVSPSRGFGELRELVGGFVDCLEVPLMLMLAPGRRDVRVPALRRASCTAR
jgi:hypothetical protein